MNESHRATTPTSDSTDVGTNPEVSRLHLALLAAIACTTLLHALLG